MKFIILEGPDGAGKSTLAKNLEREFSARGHHVIGQHFGPSNLDEPIIEQYLAPIFELRNRTESAQYETVVIFDRHYLGEMIYGPILRGASQIQHDDRAVIERYLDEIGATKVLVIDDLDELTQRFTQRGDDLITPDQLEEIMARYAHLTSGSNPAYMGARRWIQWTPQHSQLAGMWDLA